MTKNVRKISRLVFLCCLVIGFIALIVKIANGIKATDKDGDKILPYTHAMPTQDSNLVSRKHLSRLTVNNVAHILGRPDISFYSYDMKYPLLITKIDLIEDVPLKNALHLVMKDMDRTNGKTYYISKLNDYFKFECLVADAPRVSSIDLTLSGDSLASTENDSVISYRIICKNLSIKYSKDEPVDIFMVGEEKGLGFTQDIPMEILFLKRGHSVYLIAITGDTPKSSLKPDLLYNIILGDGT